MTSIVLLDFGGTIDSDGDRWCVQFHQAYRSLGGLKSLEAYEPSFRKSDLILEELADIRSMGLTAMARMQADLLSRLLREPHGPEPNQVADRFLAAVRRHVAINRAVIAELRATHRFGIVSNFTGNLAHCLAELEIADLFDVVADSALIGVRKPDPEIFRWTLGQFRVSPPPASVWMVGDNFDADVRPAAALGWSTAWVAPEARRAPVEGLATTRITSLRQLPQAIATCTV
jgi:putative hydrolase of the HAD superfamily